MDKYISITNLFKTYTYFKHPFIIDNIFTPSVCEWFYSYKEIELNPLLLYSIPHILKLINKNYEMSYHVKYEIQDIKIIKNVADTLYSTFLQEYHFKLIIPLSKCCMVLNNGSKIVLNCGEVIVLTIEHTFVITNNVNVVSIDITGSFDAINMPKNNTNSDTWWLSYLPTMDSECLRY